MRRIAAVIAVMALAAGCATWSPVGGEFRDTSRNFAVKFPEGWLRTTIKSADPLANGVQVTRDGPLLQRIILGQMKVGTELAMTKKTIRTGMLPQDVAEVVLDNFRMEKSLLRFEVLSNKPADLGQNPGFRIEYDMMLPNHMWQRMVFYGAVVGDQFFFTYYAAPRRNYFPKDLETFEAVVRSFQPLTKTAAR